MADHTIKIRSTIKPELVRLTLKRGSGFAIAGALLILFGGTMLPLSYLKIWGIPLFFSGLILISIGWLPYRKLQRLELNPHTLEYDGEFYNFAKEGKLLLKIPEKSTAKVEYVEKEHQYGVGIHLKKPVPEPVRIVQKHLNFEVSRLGYDIFLPYFSKTSAEELTTQPE